MTVNALRDARRSGDGLVEQAELASMGRAMRATRLPPPPEAVGTVMRELRAWIEDADLRDDAVVVCLDWRGSGSRDVG